MAIFKCKMCGGSLEVTEGMTVCECEYCGTQQTLPKTDNEQNLNLFNRANHFRQLCEFDKAAEIYEKMAGSSDGDAELYWSLVLCRYGIEYVDDPLTKKKIATCHRTQYKSILDDPDYQAALERADMSQRSVYEREAAYIDKIQKGILEISNKEQPFDVFICYKETDENGRRTPDSVLAQELYYGLTQEGFKVFFSRITLESKLGTEYEPYIFAALNSAKVMVVVGTKPEYFNAVWVRNEWSRYLMLMQEDRSRTLIPAYKDMDPYDLPDELSMFQAQDMSKLGFMQDLVRGIKKIVKSEPEQPVVQQTVIQQAAPASANVENLLKRGNLALEDGKWDEANRFFEQVLDENVEEHRAYIGKLCAQLHVSSEKDLVEVEKDFTGYDHYKKACRFGGDEVRNRLFSQNQQGLYNCAVKILENAQETKGCFDAQHRFEALGGFSDAAKKVEECKQKALQLLYESRISKFNAAKTVEEFAEVEKQFQKLGDFSDAAKYAEQCREKSLNIQYEAAVKTLHNARDEKSCAEAERLFLGLGNYKDSVQMVEECKQKPLQIAQEKERQLEYDNKLHSYLTAENLMKRNTLDDIENAAKRFKELCGFKNADSLLQECNKKIEELKKQAEENNRTAAIAARKKKTTIIVAVCAIILITIGIIVGVKVYQKNASKTALENVKTATIGEVVKFGKYQWNVIKMDEDENCKTLLCRECVKEMVALDCEEWLNSDFYNSFSDDEKAVMVESESGYFHLLTLNEAKELESEIRACGTEWWLHTRDIGGVGYWFVSSDGTFDDGASYGTTYGIRPAVTIKVD